MKTLGVVLGLAALAMLTPFANATHDTGCVPTEAADSDIIQVDTADGRRFYWEERGNPLGTSPPVPWSGFFLGGGTWLYEESNGIGSWDNGPDVNSPATGSMQRGGIGLTGECFPPPPLPCLIIDIDMNDADCGHGPDDIIF